MLVIRSRRTGNGVFFLRVGDALGTKRCNGVANRAAALVGNEMYAPETIDPENLGQVEVVGHCHWRGGKIF